MFNLFGKVAESAGGSAIVAGVLAAAAPPPAALSSWWDVIVLGIPLGVLAASLAGSSARSFRDESQPDKALPRRAVLTIIDGFIGGWAAMFLINFALTKSYFEGMTPAVLGAFCGLLTEYVRTNGSRWVEQLYQTALTWFSKKRPGDTPQ